MKKSKDIQSTQNLKLCPFCNRKPKLIREISYGHGVSFDQNWVECNKPKCLVYVFTQRFDSKIEAIKAWNKRGR